MSQSQDMSQYLGVFLDEATEHLALLEANILELERSQPTPEMMQVLFRSAHTIKGSSRAMGFMTIGNLTHEMENILDALRKDELALSPDIVNALLRCSDTLGNLMEAVRNSGSDQGADEAALGALIGTLEALRSGKASVAPPPQAPAAPSQAPAVLPTVSDFSLTQMQGSLIAEAREKGASVFQVTVTLSPDCLMKSVRVFMAVGALEPLGQVLAMNPAQDALEEENFDRRFDLLLATSEKREVIETALSKLSEVESYAVAPYGEPANAESDSPIFSLTQMQGSLIAEAREKGASVFQVTVTLSPDCLMKSVRVFMTLGALEPLGQVLAMNPAQDALEEENFDRRFDLLVATPETPEIIEAALSKLSEIESYGVRPYSVAEPVTAPLPKSAEQRIPLLPKEGTREGSAAVSSPRPAPSVAGGGGGSNDAKPADAPKAAAPVPQAAQTVRVDVARLDNLLNLVGEMVIERTQLAMNANALREKYPQDENAAILPDFVNRLERVTGELQDEIMKARMLPVDGVFQRFPRMMRDLAQKVGKEIDFQMFGGETELDRTVLECIGDPIIHLLRNSLDHGVEPPEGRIAAGKPVKGLVTLSARHIESSIVIEVTDDGRGIDPAKIKAASVRKGNITQSQADQMTDKDALMLIFASGLSTAETVSDISGRGVGMDIVKSNIERLGGQILIESTVGTGSTFTIRLPLTLAIMRTLLVRTGEATYVLPLSSVVEMVRVGGREGQVQKRSIQGQGTIVLRGRTVPLANLSMLLAGDPEAVTADAVPEGAYLVVVGFGDRQVGLAVDALIGQQETVIKSLGTFLGNIPGVSGATILGDGKVALIVDAPRAVELARALLPERVAAKV